MYSSLRKYWSGYTKASQSIYTYGIDVASKKAEELTSSKTEEKGYRARIAKGYAENANLMEARVRQKDANMMWGYTLAAKMLSTYSDGSAKWKIFGTNEHEDSDVLDGYACYFGYEDGLALTNDYMRQKNKIAIARL